MDRTRPILPFLSKPGAGTQIERIGPTCLDVRGRAENLWSGHGGGGWLWIWMTVTFLALWQILAFTVGGEPVALEGRWANQIEMVLMAAVFALPLLIPVWLWRTHLPVRFNRRTREVSMAAGGKVYTVPWDELAGIRRDLTGFTFPGVVLRDQLLQIDFPKADGGTQSILINGKEHVDADIPDGPDALWAYITTYMEQGPEALPQLTPYSADYFKPSELPEACRPFPIFTARDPRWWPLQLCVGFPLMCLLALTYAPTCLLHYWLYTSIPRKPLPEEMFDPENDDPSVLTGNSRPPGRTFQDIVRLERRVVPRGVLFVRNREEVDAARRRRESEAARRSVR
ncbi:DUF6708 domain-containing protein [Aquisalimonas asiatica]|uniref:DUF6708 domain-containing protein n=1 Tax=Aquisalimonas asiatica TaxID=406100 RepID=A0A1H8SAM3_9GAMM|nr:DUF6708 domain-containing protein [Aquisalimonas asiatica]SEO75566.1 hypothetical protein SAMN04488052_102634 [Aquisalimonas asiatica]